MQIDSKWMEEDAFPLSSTSFACSSNIENTEGSEFFHLSKAATRGVPWEKMFLEISQNLQENTCARVSFLIKLQASNF